jgi:hypothetical protein
MAVYLSPEHDVAIHSLSCDPGDFFVLEFQKGIASTAGGLLGPRHAELGHLTELLKELLELILIEALRQVADVNGPL